MSKEDCIYSTISSIIAEEPGLKSSISYLTCAKNQDSDYQKVEHDIKSLFMLCSSDNSSNINIFVEDMIKNITDGKFKEFLSIKPDILSMDDKALRETVKLVEVIICELDELIEKQKASPQLIDISKSTHDSLSKFDSDIETKNSIEKCISSLKRLQSNFSEFEVDGKYLLKNNTRDLAFENNIKKLIKQIGDINMFIDSKRTISRLHKKKNREKKSIPAASALSTAISELLKEVESVNYIPED